MRRSLLVLLAACGSAPGSPVDGSQVSIAPGRGVHAAPVLLVGTPNLLTSTRPLPADVAQFRSAGSARLSPDGSQLAYAVRWATFDPSAKPKGDDDHSGGWKVEAQLFVAPTTGAVSPRQLTYADKPAGNPRWSPGGQELAFLRQDPKTAKTALWVLSMRGGEARRVETGELEPGSFEWLRGTTAPGFAFIAEPVIEADEKSARWRRGGARRYDRDWPSASLFTIGDAPGAKPTRVNREEHIVSFAQSPSGDRFAVVASASSNPYEAFSLTRVRIIDRAGAVLATPMDKPGAVGHIAWSADGKYVAFERAANGLSHLDQLSVVSRSGEITNAAAKLDPSLAGFVWSGSSLIAHVQVKTGSQLYRLPPDGRSAQLLAAPGRALSGIHGDERGRAIASISSTLTSPPDPSVYDIGRGKVRVAASVNPQVSDWTLGKSRVVRWKNREGTELEGILTETPHRAGGPAPLLVLPHGGPDSVTMESFSSLAHYFAARGYSVLRPNYRGGFGYGHDFYAANRGRLGDIELLDIESGVDALIASGDADPERLFYGGWSWGGYITAWTITRTTRYRAAVVGAGVVDTVVQYVTSDINHGVAADWEFRGRPWVAPETFARSNPALGLSAVETPTLIIHGERDDRVGFINGQTLYRALADKGTEVEFFAYPREPHGFREPAHTIHMLTEWARWYEKHSR